MAEQVRYPLPAIPTPLAGLVELALDLRWSWSHSSHVLWRRLDPELWEATGNPWQILQSVSHTRLLAAAEDEDFVELMKLHLRERRELLDRPSWFQARFPTSVLRSVAYFSMEFGLGEALPLYSGGLGILAGDFLKAASDMGVPITGIGLLWQQGYFRQALSANGEQIEFFPFNAPGQLPVTPLRDASGEWLDITVPFPRRQLHLRVWQVRAGRTRLFLLDANSPFNRPADRGMTGELYGGGQEVRLQQEMILGIGGWRVLCALNESPDICHLNEGHAALAIVERARCYAEDHRVSFSEAMLATRPGNLFTTHTPVEAGFDRFPAELIGQYLGAYLDQSGLSLDDLLALGRGRASGAFNMAYLAMAGSGAVNAVSRLHGEVSRRLFQPLFPRWPQAEVPVGHVTNGVHVPSWDSSEADTLWTKACGKDRWSGDVEGLGDRIRALSDEELWAFRDANRRRLVATARELVARQGTVAGSLESLGDDLSCLCDPGVLTLAFARRFATYKRPNLLLHDADRLERLLCGEKSRVQLVLAGKAHPADAAGKAMIREWTEFIARCTVRPHIIFLVDYDMGLAEHLVHGADVWINTPRRPWEACGTSGMKVLVNGGMNLSELDGWWAEAYSPEVGWALGDGQEHLDGKAWDASEAEQLYDLLENHIIPEFYDRDPFGIPRRWIARVRESMARLTPQLSTNRMMREYLEQYYLPGAARWRTRSAPERAGEMGSWIRALDEHWDQLAFGDFSVTTEMTDAGQQVTAILGLDLGGMPADAVRVELYAEPLPGEPPERRVLVAEPPITTSGASGDLRSYRTSFFSARPTDDYTPRVIPWHPDAAVPLECDRILWYR